MHCMSSMHKVKCNAQKIIEINKTTQETKVFHYGNHSCTPKGIQAKPNKESLKESFINNPKLKPMERCVHAVINAIETNKSIRNRQCCRGIHKYPIRQGRKKGGNERKTATRS